MHAVVVKFWVVHVWWYEGPADMYIAKTMWWDCEQQFLIPFPDVELQGLIS